MRQINFDAPLSEDDKAWLRDRDRHAEVEANEARFTEYENDETKTNGPEDDYDSWKRDELKAEAESREGLDTTGLSKKDEYIAALRSWDAANPEG